MTIEELSSLPVKYFAKYQPNLLRDFWKNSSHAVDTNDEKTRELIKVVDELITFLKKGTDDFVMTLRSQIYDKDGQNMRFGSFLANFIPLKNFKSFLNTDLQYEDFWEEGCESDWYDYDDEYEVSTESTKFCCKELDEHELFIHNYFSVLSTLIGFDESNNISLFDIPSILANIDATPISALTSTPKLLHPYLFTRCQKEDEIHFVGFHACVKEWNLYLGSNGSSKI